MSASNDPKARAIVMPARRARGVRTIAIAPHIVLAASRAHDVTLLIDADDTLIADALAANARAPHEISRTRDGIARIDAELASALPLARGWLASALPGATRALVSIPSRDTLLFTSDASEASVRALADRAERAFHVAHHPVSPAIYEARADGTLTPFRADGALENATALGHALLAMTEYEAQRAELNAKPRDGVWIAECRLILREGDDRPLTVATWGERVTTLLPIVDVVVIAGGDTRGDGWQFAVRWDVLEARVGRTCFSIEESLDALVPTRVRTIAWPDSPTLLALYAARDSLLARTASPPP